MEKGNASGRTALLSGRYAAKAEKSTIAVEAAQNFTITENTMISKRIVGTSFMMR